MECKQHCIDHTTLGRTFEIPFKNVKCDRTCGIVENKRRNYGSVVIFHSAVVHILVKVKRCCDKYSRSNGKIC